MKIKEKYRKLRYKLKGWLNITALSVAVEMKFTNESKPKVSQYLNVCIHFTVAG